jgi:signal transduction histidine kinase
VDTESSRALANDARQKRVLVLYSDRIDLPSNMMVDAALRVKLHERFGLELDFHGEYVESARFPEENYRLALRDFVQRKYEGRRFDAVIGIARSALQFLEAHGHELFPDTPIVGFGADDVVASWNGPPMTGVVSPLALDKTVDLLLRLRPDTRDLVVVSGTSSVDLRLAEEARRALRDERRANITYLSGLGLDDLLNRLSRLPERTAVFFLTMTSDGSGRQFRTVDVLSRVTARANAPVYVISVVYLGTGAVGGVLVDQAAMADQTADLAIRVLGGEPLQSLPAVTAVPAMPIFDRRQLRRWGIAESALPREASIRFVEPSVWDLYKWYIVGAVFVCTTQGTLIAGLLIQRRRRKRVEQEAQLQRRELAHLSRVATLGELTGALAHELSQPLTAIHCNAKAARRFLASSPPDMLELQDSLDEILDADDRASDVIHRLRGFLKKNRAQRRLVDLNAVVIDTLKMARNDLLERVVLTATQLAPDLPQVLGDRVELQQVVLNLVLNACDAMAGQEPARRRLSISTERTRKGRVRVTVTDQGPGLPSDVESLFEPFFTSKEHGLGLGLAICRSIVRDHGGDVRASANPGAGATFWFTLPAAGSDVEAANDDSGVGMSLEDIQARGGAAAVTSGVPSPFTRIE